VQAMPRPILAAMRRALVILHAALLLAAAPLLARAQGVAPEDARAIRAVIEAQLDAFRHDDGPRAFSYATAEIRETFGTPESFMEMVRGQYAVVYRPRSVLFDAPRLVEGEVVQPVRFTDAGGHAWIALYPMQREADGTWRINGCHLGRVAGQET
jgi:uncharacterized protein DUF4864